MSIFRAYDIRGIVGDTLTEEIVFQIGQAIGSEAHHRNQSTVVVCRDGRLSGPALIGALIRGLRSTGRNVIDIGMAPTPVLYFATYHLNTGSGVMLTGSHNPPDYNGLKIMLGGDTLFGDDIQALKHRIDHGELHSAPEGELHQQSIIDDYIERICGDVKLNPERKPFKVVVDCGNGVAGNTAPQLLEKLGCEIHPLFCEVDGNFPNHHPDPSQPENLEDMERAIAKTGADIGLAFDGDGDRLGVMDAQGNVIWPDRQLMLYAQDVLSRHPGAEIVYDVKCSRHLDAVIKENGGEPLMWKTGHSFIKSKLKEDPQAMLAGEMSGHIFFKERWYGFDDGIYTATRLLEILSNKSEPPIEVLSALPDAINTPELKINMQEGEHFAFMQRILDNARFDDAKVSTIDGLRADFADGWGLIRPSNTTPCLVLRFEADDEASLQRIQDDFRQQLLSLDNTLQLPF
ncbi:MAG: phosphomannomutase/phosphoglucomutase [Pseudomonadota bacterium]